MQNKMAVNEATMHTHELKRKYVQSQVGGNALAHVKSRLGSDTTRPFATADEMFAVVEAGFGDLNRQPNARAAYRALRQGTKDFSVFWAEFQLLASELDNAEDTLIDNLIDKSHHSIQQQLATGGEDSTNLVELAKRCQLNINVLFGLIIHSALGYYSRSF